MSTTNEADKIPVLYVEKKEKGTLTITATPEPGAEWPVDGETKYPIWSGSGGAVDSKDPAKYVLALDTAGSCTISASCGNTVSVKVVVIDMKPTEFSFRPVRASEFQIRSVRRLSLRSAASGFR